MTLLWSAQCWTQIADNSCFNNATLIRYFASPPRRAQGHCCKTNVNALEVVYCQSASPSLSSSTMKSATPQYQGNLNDLCFAFIKKRPAALYLLSKYFFELSSFFTQLTLCTATCSAMSHGTGKKSLHLSPLNHTEGNPDLSWTSLLLDAWSSRQTVETPWNLLMCSPGLR